jgi:hypothetical protein
MRSHIFAVLFFITVTSLYAGNPADDLVDLSGVGFEIKHLPDQFITGFQGGGAALKNADSILYEKLIASVKSSFDYEKSIAYLKKNLTEKLDKKEITFALKWLKSDLGRKITKLEDEMSKPENSEKAMSYTGEFSSDKKALVGKLMTSLNVVDNITDISLQSSLAVAYSLSSVQATAEGVDLDIVKTQVEQMRSAIKAQLEQVLVKVMCYAYEPLEVKELQKYLEFNVSPMGPRYNEVMSDAVLDIMKKITGAFTGTLIDYYKKKGRAIKASGI